MRDDYIVLDTNVLLSAIITPRGGAARAVAVAIELYRPAVSRATLAELAAKMWQPKFARWVSPQSRSRFFGHVVQVSVMFDPVPMLTVATDPDDNAFISLAAAVEAAYIVTGDKAFLALRAYNDCEIVSPTEFLTRHRRQ